MRPHPISAPREKAQDVYVWRIEHVLLALGDILSNLGDSANYFVSGSFVDTALDVDSRVEVCQVARWGYWRVALGQRIAHFNPWVIERGVFRVVSEIRESLRCSTHPVDREWRSGL